MGKDKKRDPERKAALQAQKAQKAEKKEAKRLLKENLKDVGGGGGAAVATESFSTHYDDDDIDCLIEAYKKQTLDLTSVCVQTIDDVNQPFPFPPRGNATFTAIPTTGEFVLFGGEYNNGVENIVFDELFRWDPDAKSTSKKSHARDSDGDEDDDKDHQKQKDWGVWKRILTPAPRPTPRCSHSCVYYDHCLFLFGGEFGTVDTKYHHYRDLWKFELKSNTWIELKPKGNGPSPRSGHRAIVWRHYMILFGGFFETQHETRWFNDLYALDFSSLTWTEFVYSKFTSIPPERSAFNFGLCPGKADVAFLYGGFSKLKAANPGMAAETRVYSDCWECQLKYIEQGRSPVWERLSRRGEYPSQRSGSACATYKDKLLVFGGVQDQEEGESHKIVSVFYDDLFSFDMERKRWFQINLKKSQIPGARRRRRKDANVSSLNNSSRIDDNGQQHEKAYEDDTSDEDATEVALDREASSHGWDVEKLRSSVLTSTTGNTEGIVSRDQEKVSEKQKIDVNVETHSRSTPLPRINALLGRLLILHYSFHAYSTRNLLTF